MSDQVKFFNLDPLWRRLLLVVPVGLVLVSVWFVARWCVGNTLAAYPPDAETVREAARLAPSDPQVHYTLAVFARKSFEPGRLEESLGRYEAAVALSPNDYRLWQELGRARGQAGDIEGGERALRRAVELAPHYAMPRWYLGNMLLRAGRTGEAFDVLREAAELNPPLRQQVFALAWGVYGGDARGMREVAGPSAAMRAQLIEYFLNQKRTDDALEVWSGLSDDEKREQQAAGGSLVRVLLGAGRAHTALEVFRALAPDAARAVSVGQISNGSFEQDIPVGEDKNPFDWEVKPVPQAQIGLDTRHAAGGRRSLRLSFAARAQLAFGNVSQLVAVEPNARYRLTFSVRTDDLKSVSTIAAYVSDPAAQGRVLATSAPAPAGTTDWQQASVEFAAPPKTEAVMIRLERVPCAEDVCPIYGRIWYDDFSLQRLDGGAR